MRRAHPLLFLALTALPFWMAVAAPSRAADELAQYIAQPDASYRFDIVSSGAQPSGDYVVAMLTSQTWRGVEWKHQLFLFRPKRVDSKQALLYIDGGRWRAEYENGRVELPREAAVFIRLAQSIRAPVAVIRQVPFQPLFDRREDALIAYTFDRYLDTGEADWPLLLPMVKGAVRAMDAVQALAQSRWQLPIERFTVAGASKRGWTSWLTAASDPRVAGVVPMVIDMLNLPAQIQLQRDTFGELSEQVQDYATINLPDRIDSDRGRSLLEMVDPYSYRASLTLPKLILLGTNDRYWPLDALSLYWNALTGPTHVLYVPNQGHSVRDLRRVVGALSALHRYSERGEELPSISWSFDASPRDLQLSVQPGRKPAHVTAWSASSSTRDFREAQWSSGSCRASQGAFVCRQPVAAGRYTALYSEVTFEERGEPGFSLSTAVCIVDSAGTMVRQCLNHPRTMEMATTDAIAR
jgi:PhoPQ-activated pathogenicity-related protein